MDETVDVERVRRTAREQFTADAESFASSPVATDLGALDVVAGLCLAGPGVTVVDAACGPGVVSCHLAAAGATVTGVDLTPRMLELARDLARRSGVADSTRFVEGVMESLPVPDASVTVALSRYALHHAADPDAVAAELVRVVRPGGRVVVVDFAAATDERVAAAYDEAERWRDPSHVANLTEQAQRDLFERRDWTRTGVERYRLPVRLGAVLARSNSPDPEAVRLAFERSLGNHGLGVGARAVDGDIHFAYPIVAQRLERA